MNIESREDAARLAKLIIERDARITALVEELRTKDMLGLGLKCTETVQLEQLSAENATAARVLALWFVNQPLPLPIPPPLMKPQIRLILVRPDIPPNSPPTNVQIGGNRVTPTMLEAAEDLLHTITTGVRKLPKDLYEVVARAFGTTRDDAKGRILLAIYSWKWAPITLPPEEPST